MKNNWIAYLALFSLAILLPVGSVCFFRFLQRRWPVPRHCRESKPGFEALKRRYSKWDLLGGLLGVLFGVMGAYVSWLLCRNLCSWRSGFFTGDHLLFPKHGICLLPAVPGAIAAGVAGSLISTKLLLNERFGEFFCYGSLKLGIDVIRLLRVFAVGAAFFWIAGIVLPVDTYMILSPKEIQYNCLLGFGDNRHQYADIEAIEQVVDVKSRFKKDFSIRLFFKDGSTWNSAGTEELSEERAKVVSDYISRKTNVPIQQHVVRR